MKISIITVCYNSEKTIKRAINSVLSQKNIDLEYILVDGKSSDSTLSIITEYYNNFNSVIKYVSEKDSGIYDAMNKGIQMATGDIIGILNSDDMYANENVLSTVISTFENNDIDTCYGNILYVKSENNKLIPFRYWKSGKPRSPKFGWMPPHPAFFVKKEIYNKYGIFRLDCGTAADYELMIRLFEINKISSYWINEIFTYMEAGGASGNSIKAYKEAQKNEKKGWVLNNKSPVLGLGFIKKIRKIPQFITAKFIKL